jgi:hypothetical protein
MEKLTDHIYILPGHDSEGPNPKIVLLTGKESSLLIDVSNDPKQLDEVLAFQKKEGLSAVKFVALTHFHDDHIGNLIYLPDGIEILASKNTARYLNRPARILAEDTLLDLGDYPLSSNLGSFAPRQRLPRCFSGALSLCWRFALLPPKRRLPITTILRLLTRCKRKWRASLLKWPSPPTNRRIIQKARSSLT